MNSEQGDAAFLDIAANLLAIILIVTLFSLLTVQHHSHSADDPDAVSDPALPFMSPQRDLFPPFSRFYFALQDRIVVWQQADIITALLQSPLQLTGTTAQGRYQWQPEGLTPHDIDTYRLHFFPDAKAIREQALAFDALQAEQLLARLRQDYRESRVAAVFIVYPSGMDAFARLYPALEQARLRFRWFSLAEEAPLYLGRYAAQFTDYNVYW